MNLLALREALENGSSVGALVHEKSGIARRAEVLAVEESRVLALAHVDGKDAGLFDPGAYVRLDLPRETSVICVPGRVTQSRPRDGVVELEIACLDGAEDRQRRMDVRVDAECRIRVLGGGAWLEKRTVNVSAGGALVADGDPAHPGDLVDVELDLDGDTIRCRAEVVRRGVKTGGVTSRTNAALRFIGLPAAQRDRIAVYVLSAQARQKAARHHAPGVRAPRPDDDSPE
jgi:hypothetical protein